jgi:RNA polymerase sigma-54 factor
LSPYSDEDIKSLLAEKDIVIARRTIAKYREKLGIPVARLRKDTLSNKS